MEKFGALTHIGSTPLFTLNLSDNISNNHIIYVKAEYLNPGGSIKDRVAFHIIQEAKKRNELRKGDLIVEATSGNTGISVAMVGCILGYEVAIIMPENMSIERRKLIRALNAKLILTPKNKNVAGAVEKLEEMRNNSSNIFIPDQFKNKNNIDAHYRTTGPEIWKDMSGKVDVFVSGIGSGGTIMGVGTYLKEKNPEIKIVAVEPKDNSALLGHEPGLHRIEGIGDGFIPEILDQKIIDEIFEVDDEDALTTARRLSMEKGLLVGISSGANVMGAMLAAKKFGKEKRIVTILPDRIERYFSTDLLSFL
ncbi:MAG: cysteine synthase A [Desulfobulbus propionicus]|nr:MAG: cysteine synthase A [Desulfobulbus propionicus]